MISIQFELNSLPLSQICDTARQLLRQGHETFARVAVKQKLSNVIYFIDMQKHLDGHIEELIWNTGTISEDTKHNHVQGVDTAAHQG